MMRDLAFALAGALAGILLMCILVLNMHTAQDLAAFRCGLSLVGCP